MFRRRSKLRKILGDYVSPDAIEGILSGEPPAEAEIRSLNFVWIWFSDRQLAGSEVGSAVEIASGAGGVVDIFPPIAAFWFGLFEDEIETSKVIEELRRYADGGAKIIHGATSGSLRIIGSQSHMSCSVLSPDRSQILSCLAAAEDGSVTPFETKANKALDDDA